MQGHWQGLTWQVGQQPGQISLGSLQTLQQVQSSLALMQTLQQVQAKLVSLQVLQHVQSPLALSSSWSAQALQGQTQFLSMLFLQVLQNVRVMAGHCLES